MSRSIRSAYKALLQPATLLAVNTVGPVQNCKLHRFSELVVTLAVTAASRDAGTETYDVYITTTDGVSTWDLVHFTQVASTGAKTFTARVLAGGFMPETITGATPGVAALDPGVMKTDTSGSAQGILTLASGMVRHGPFGDSIGYQLVVANAPVTGLAFSIQIEAR